MNNTMPVQQTILEFLAQGCEVTAIHNFRRMVWMTRIAKDGHPIDCDVCPDALNDLAASGVLTCTQSTQYRRDVRTYTLN